MRVCSVVLLVFALTTGIDLEMKVITITAGHLGPSYFPTEAHLEHSHTLTIFRKGK
jgi:hypothetical protein